jgi:hypothetical protein
MCVEVSTVLRAVAVDFFFNCWCLKIPSDQMMEKCSCFITQVYVLDEEKQLVMVIGSKPTTVEKNMENITK